MFSPKTIPIFFCLCFLMFLPRTNVLAEMRIGKPEVPYRSDELLVKFNQSADTEGTEAELLAVGADTVRGFRRPRQVQATQMDNWRHIRLKQGLDLEATMEKIAEHPGVEQVERNYMVYAHVTPNDPRFTDMWNLHNIGQTGGASNADIDAPEAWDSETGDGSVIVAVLDSGVDYNHQDLADNMWVNRHEVRNGIDDDDNGCVDDIHGCDFANNDGDPFDDLSHGTHVAGTIAAVGDNGIGVVGVNWSARIMAIKFLTASGQGSISDAVDGLLYAIDNGAQIINNSWGGASSSLFEDAIATAEQSGVLLVFSADNGGQDCEINSCLPAELTDPNIISVAATNDDDDLADFSNFGSISIDLGAPGVDIWSTTPNDTYDGTFSGTSMAAPHVAGAAALIVAQDPRRGYSDVKGLILACVDAVPALAGKTVTGGRLNIANALSEDCAPDDTLAVPLLMLKNLGTEQCLSWDVDDAAGTSTISADTCQDIQLRLVEYPVGGNYRYEFEGTNRWLSVGDTNTIRAHEYDDIDDKAWLDWRIRETQPLLIEHVDTGNCLRQRAPGSGEFSLASCSIEDSLYRFQQMVLGEQDGRRIISLRNVETRECVARVGTENVADSAVRAGDCNESTSVRRLIQHDHAGAVRFQIAGTDRWLSVSLDGTDTIRAHAYDSIDNKNWFNWIALREDLQLWQHESTGACLAQSPDGSAGFTVDRCNIDDDRLRFETIQVGEVVVTTPENPSGPD